MAQKLNYTPEEILNIKFSPKEKGYDSLEVDKIFDAMIEDYKSFANLISEHQNANKKLQSEIDNLKEELAKATFDVATLKKQLNAMPKIGGVTDDNFKLLKKVTAYERVLYRKGIDLKKALSDPDNC